MATPETGLASIPAEAQLEGGRQDSIHQNHAHVELQPTQSAPLASERSWYNFRGKRKATPDLSHLDEKWPIVYHTLTFETTVPQPPNFNTVRRSRLPPPLPQPPNLSKYTNPFKWSSSRKRAIVWLSCFSTVFTAFTAGSYSPGAPEMAAEWGVSEEAVLVGITTFTCGFAVAPMVLAPFSEINGRRPCFIASGILFVICQLCCAITQSYAGMMLARFFVGVGGSVFSTMVGGVMSDIYGPEDRNTAMAIFSGGALFGTGFGPIIGSLLVYHLNWRWMFWEQLIVDFVLMIFIIAFFKETRGPVLLARKAKKLNAYYEECEAAGWIGVIMPDAATVITSNPPSHTSTPKASTTTLSTSDTLSDPEKNALDMAPPTAPQTQRIRWKVAGEEDRTSISKMIKISLSRPFLLLVTEPVVFSFSLWVSFSWAVLYMTLAAVPLVYTTNYNFNTQERGAIFTSICVGAILFTIICIHQEKWARRPTSWVSKWVSPEKWASPESRLVFACVESALLPVGLFIFGWTAQAGFNYVQDNGTTVGQTIPWIAPTIALTVATMGIFSIYLAVFNYMADAYGLYASSALASQSFCRNIVGGAFPLVTNALFENLGYGNAGTMLGAMGVALTFVPWILLLAGPWIRRRSKYALQD